MTNKKISTGVVHKIPFKHLKILQDKAMGPDFRVPQVRVVSREQMNRISGAMNQNVYRYGGRVLVASDYWYGTIEQERLDVLMHEAMADWAQRKGVDA